MLLLTTPPPLGTVGCVCSGRDSGLPVGGADAGGGPRLGGDEGAGHGEEAEAPPGAALRPGEGPALVPGHEAPHLPLGL